jgi:hypothetical protein
MARRATPLLAPFLTALLVRGGKKRNETQTRHANNDHDQFK